MNKFYYFYNPVCTGANTPTAFESDPYVTLVKELFIIELRQLVFYIEKLKSVDIDMTLYTDKVIEFISVLIVNLDFKKESFFVIFEDLYNNKIMLKKMYISACEKLATTPDLLIENDENLNSKDVILNIINDKTNNLYNLKNKEKITKTQKYLYEIIISLVLNACNCLIELKNYGIDFDDGKNSVLKLLNSANFINKTDDELKQIIFEFSKSNYQIVNLLYEKISDTFGEVSLSKVNICKKQGKAILVSGKSLEDLDKILIAIKGLNINVYTHNGMINAFQYEYFKNNPNLAGHYQYAENNYSIDFASFPGPIYISGNAAPKVDIIRGQIYTSAKYPANGIAKIINNDFTPLIKYALDSKGFDTEIQYGNLSIGYDNLQISEQLNKLVNQIKNGQVQRLIIIGSTEIYSSENEYINDLISECSDTDFIMSFSNYSRKNNFWKVNYIFDFYLLYKILKEIMPVINEYNVKVAIFFNDCNRNVVSHIFNLLYLNVKNIYLGQCCPNIIKPVLTLGLKEIFGVKPFINPKKDLEII
ncbi:hypothetical protein IJ182_01685 [bacterium]|nr:hypothetical protein [bacterium]